jgi:flagellar hook-length control protein FliK
MQINNIGFAGLLGAGGASTNAAGSGMGDAFGLLLGAPNNPAGAGMTPPLAANDSAAPAASMPSVSMAQLLTTAAPLATGTTPLTSAQPPLGGDAAPALPQDPALVAPQVPEAPAKPDVAAPAIDAKPAKTAPGAKPAADPLAEMLGAQPDAAPALPGAEAPVEEPKAETPVKRGPRLADADADAADQPAPDAVPVVVVDPVAAALVQQAPVRPELAVKPQPSPTRQVGEVSLGGRKADAARTAPTEATAKGPEPAANGAKANAAVSAIAGKQGEKNDSAPGDERGQAPAFTLRHDGQAAPTHSASEPAKATPAVAAAEPVVTARPGHLGQQMGVEIARKVEAGEDTLRVRLNPENLGKVEVTLAFDDGGKLHATVRAETQQALDMLRQDMPDLGRSLDQAGIRTDAQSFRFESRSDGGGAQAHQQQGQNQNSVGQFAGNDEPEATEAYRAIRGDGQVDLLA